MLSIKTPVTIPRYIVPVRADCECRRKQMDLEFKYISLQWEKDIAATVCKGEVICEAEVEKVFFEIYSPADGILSEICVQSGESCDIHKPIAYVTSL